MIEAKEAKKRIMAAARHLCRSRMAWVVYQLTSGYDWKGSNKGTMAEYLATGRISPGAKPRKEIDESTLIRIENALRDQENAKGETGRP